MPSQLFIVIPNDRFIILQLQVPSMDVEVCDELKAQLLAQTAERRASVILDLSRAKFLPSLAIGSLVNIKKRLDEQDGTLTLVGLSQNIRKSLQLSDLHKVFRLAERIEDAMTHSAAETRS